MEQDKVFPSGEIKQIKGSCLVLKGDDIDTDRIIPARFLKCVSFKDLGDQVFADDRIEMKGSHPFDINKGSSILIVNCNFGCGSSREHAPQALMRWGIRAIIGQSFAEIFFGNCLALGIPCATSEKKTIQEIQQEITKSPTAKFNLEIQKLVFESPNKSWNLSMENGQREMLLSGRWDVTSQLIDKENKVQSIKKNLPYLTNFKE